MAELTRKGFYDYARGSLEEAKAWLRTDIRRELISPEETFEYKNILGELGPRLNAFIEKTS